MIKVTILPQQSRGGDVSIELTLENISKKNLAFHEFSAFCLFDKNGQKYRFCNMVSLHHENNIGGDAISALLSGAIDPKAVVSFSNIKDYLNKSLVFVFQPKLDWINWTGDYPPIEESNVFLAFDLGKIE